MPGHFPESMLVFVHSGIPGVCLISDHASSLLLSAGFFIDLAQSNIMAPLNQTERSESRKRISGRLPHGVVKTDRQERSAFQHDIFRRDCFRRKSLRRKKWFEILLRNLSSNQKRTPERAHSKPLSGVVKTRFSVTDHSLVMQKVVLLQFNQA